MALEEVGARLRLADRVKFGRDARGAADDVERLGDAADRTGRELGQAERKAARAGAVFGQKLGRGAAVGAKGLGKLGRFAGGLAKAGALGAVGLAAGAATGGRALLGLSGQLELTGNKARTVFGDQLAGVTTWAEGSAEKMGLTTNELLGMGAGFADLLVPMGFTRKQAAGLTQQTLGLSGALSQWSGGTKSAAEVSDILASAMLGETDALKGLGIGLSAAEVEAKLLERGQSKLTGQALEQAKAQATLDLILGKSTDAQKAYADGTNKLGLAQSKLSAKWKTLKEQAAQRFAPYAVKFLEKLSDAFPKVQRVVGEFVRSALPGIREGFGELRESLGKVAARFGGLSQQQGKAKTLGETIGGLAKHLLNLAGELLEWWATVYQKVLHGIAGIARAVGSLMGTFESMFGALSKLPGVGKHFEGTRDALAQAQGKAESFADTLDRLARPRVVTFTAVYKSSVQAGAAPGVARAEAMERRATGGRLSLGMPTLVGERGPELLVPQSHGYLLTAQRTASTVLGGPPALDDDAAIAGDDLAAAIRQLAEQPVVVQIDGQAVFRAWRRHASDKIARR